MTGPGGRTLPDGAHPPCRIFVADTRAAERSTRAQKFQICIAAYRGRWCWSPVCARASRGVASTPGAAGIRIESTCAPWLGGVRNLLVEAVGTGVHLAGHDGAAGMAGVFDDDEFRAGPGVGELPRGAGAAAEVVAAVDQDPGDAGQLAGLADQRTVLEETVVREVVRADAHERQLRVVGSVAVRAGAPTAFLRDDRVLPGHPLGRGPRPDTDVGVLHHPRVRLEQTRD